MNSIICDWMIGYMIGFARLLIKLSLNGFVDSVCSNVLMSCDRVLLACWLDWALMVLWARFVLMFSWVATTNYIGLLIFAAAYYMISFLAIEIYVVPWSLLCGRRKRLNLLKGCELPWNKITVPVSGVQPEFLQIFGEVRLDSVRLSKKKLGFTMKLENVTYKIESKAYLTFFWHTYYNQLIQQTRKP